MAAWVVSLTDEPGSVGNPWKTARHGTKVGSSVPACGKPFGLGFGHPLKGPVAGGGVREKNNPKQFGGPPPNATGRKALGTRVGPQCPHLRGRSKCRSPREQLWCACPGDHRRDRCAGPGRWNICCWSCCRWPCLSGQ